MSDLFNKKLAMLQDKGSVLRTKELADSLPVLLAEYEARLMDLATHRSNNINLVAALGSDCVAVKEFLASLNPPELKDQEIDGAVVGKKTTLADKAAWLAKQRTENKELVALIAKQASVMFVQEGDKAAVDVALQRLQNARAVLAIKTAQLNFLAGDKE